MLGHRFAQTVQHFVTMNISSNAFAVLAKTTFLDSLIRGKEALLKLPAKKTERKDINRESATDRTSKKEMKPLSASNAL